MICGKPIYIKDPKYLNTSGYGKHYISVPCGHCYACLSNKRAAWAYRLRQEAKYSQSSYFVTLTYDTAYLPDNGVNKRDCQLFFKRLRKLGYVFKYFLSSEYGDTYQRAHYHCILFFKDFIDQSKLIIDVTKTWKLGYIKVDQCNDARIAYTTHYILKPNNVPDGKNKNFILCSKRPAIGIDFLESPTKDWLQQFPRERQYLVDPSQGFKISVPRYYVKKLYGEKTPLNLSLKKEKFILKRKNEHENNSKDYYINALGHTTDEFKAIYNDDRYIEWLDYQTRIYNKNTKQNPNF